MARNAYQANPEKYRERGRAWAAANPEKRKASFKAWATKNPEKQRTRAAVWRTANQEKARAHNAAWRVANPGYAAAWRAANPEKERAHSRKTKTGWSAEVFEAAWESQAGLCGLCGEPMIRGGRQAKSGVADHWEADGVKKPRSILHMTCNADLGFIEKLTTDAIFKGRPLALYLTYLERHNGSTVQKSEKDSRR